MRSVGSELRSAAVILAIPVGIVAAFPFEALSFRAENVERDPARAAFVRMTPAAERRALRLARASWQEKGFGARQMRADLFSSELPEERRLSVLTLRDRSRPPLPPELSCERTPFLPSQRAPAPSTIRADVAPEPSAFPREELLRMN